jgi:hypothetical protein
VSSLNQEFIMKINRYSLVAVIAQANQMGLGHIVVQLKDTRAYMICKAGFEAHLKAGDKVVHRVTNPTLIQRMMSRVEIGA